MYKLQLDRPQQGIALSFPSATQRRIYKSGTGPWHCRKMPRACNVELAYKYERWL